VRGRSDGEGERERGIKRIDVGEEREMECGR
jgi:hypothetical protein